MKKICTYFGCEKDAEYGVKYTDGTNNPNPRSFHCEEHKKINIDKNLLTESDYYILPSMN